MLKGTQPRPFPLHASPTTAPSPGSGQGVSQPSPSAYSDFIHTCQRHQQAQLPSSPLSRVHSLMKLAHAVLYQLECSVTLRDCIKLIGLVFNTNHASRSVVPDREYLSFGQVGYSGHTKLKIDDFSFAVREDNNSRDTSDNRA